MKTIKEYCFTVKGETAFSTSPRYCFVCSENKNKAKAIAALALKVTQDSVYGTRVKGGTGAEGTVKIVGGKNS